MVFIVRKSGQFRPCFTNAALALVPKNIQPASLVATAIGQDVFNVAGLVFGHGSNGLVVELKTTVTLDCFCGTEIFKSG